VSRPEVQIVRTDPRGSPGVVAIEQVGTEPYALTGTTVGAVVDSATTAAEVLRIVVRGADAAIRLDLPDDAAFLDTLRRVADVRVAVAPALAGDQRALLELLARGLTAGEAARQLGMSLRTAHRRLGAARLALGAASNAEAVARLGTAPDDG
jgi:DNA-binding CsgD family transcriptional regulator